MNDIIRALQTQLTKATGGSPEAAHIHNLIGPLKMLERPINDTHARRLKDALKIAIASRPTTAYRLMSLSAVATEG